MDSKTWIENTLFSINGCLDQWMQRANYGVKSYMWTTGGKGQYPNPALFKDHLRIWNLTPPLQPHCQHPELSSHRLSLDHCRCFKQVSLFPPTENILSRAPGMVLLKYQSDFISLLLKALQLDPIPLREKKKIPNPSSGLQSTTQSAPSSYSSSPDLPLLPFFLLCSCPQAPCCPLRNTRPTPASDSALPRPSARNILPLCASGSCPQLPEEKIKTYRLSNLPRVSHLINHRVRIFMNKMRLSSEISHTLVRNVTQGPQFGLCLIKGTECLSSPRWICRGWMWLVGTALLCLLIQQVSCAGSEYKNRSNVV